MSSAMFSCREASRLVSDSMDRELTLMEKVSLRVHLAMCSACVRNRKQSLAIRSAVRAARPADTLSADARERIRKALSEAVG